MLIITADPNVKIEQGEKGLYLDHVDVPISMFISYPADN